MLNKAQIIGRLGQDPEVKDLGNGHTVCNFSVATSEKWKDKKTGEEKEKTEWHRVVVWGKLAEICGKYLEKGRQVYVEGKIESRSWDKEDGSKGYSTEIRANEVKFLGGKSAGAAGSDVESTMNPNVRNHAPGADNDFGPEPQFDSSDEIPF